MHDKLQVAVKLGEGGINQKIISPLPYQRGLAAISEFREMLNRYPVESITALATSAIRTAENGQEFIAEIEEKYGITVWIIDGNREAELIYRGVRQSMPPINENILVIDIGGGSVEFIIARDGHIFWKESFLLGSARLIEKFHCHDPISREEQRDLVKYLSKMLDPLKAALDKFPANILVGSAGSFETLVELIENYRDKSLNFNTFCEISIPDFMIINEILVHSTLEQRLEMKGMAGYRAEMMVMASLIVDFIISEFSITSLYASSYSMKEGALVSLY